MLCKLLIYPRETPQKYITNAQITAPTKLINKPVTAICLTDTSPVPKIIALGGVATGSIKAIEADIVAGIMSINGLIPVLMAIPAKIGRTISVVAVLEVSSVKNVITKQIIKTTKSGCKSAIPAR